MTPLKTRLLAFAKAPWFGARPVSASLLAWAMATTAQATVFTDLQLSQLPADSAQFVLPGDAGEPTLTITELGAIGPGTMGGSDLFGYQGLWLGAPGQGGSYSWGFSQAVGSLSISFIALTSQGVNGVDGIETLGNIVTDQPSVFSLSSANGSVSWDGATVTPLDDDGRGSLLWQAPGAGFTSLRFDHRQPVPLNGFVVTGVVYSPFLPEPTTLLMSISGLLFLLIRLSKRPPVQGGLLSQS